jgi:UDPglucose--hexose-1-phosphate uridylyltransferase
MSAQSERRIDPWTGQVVVVAHGRAGIGASRPAGKPEVGANGCPFCPGREAETETTLAHRGEPWRVRVVGNKYPLTSGAFPGSHEVIIESRRHDAELHTLEPSELGEVLSVWRERASVATQRARAVLLFRNRGRRAGSSQPHPHSQIVALDEAPEDMRRRARPRSALDQALHVERQAKSRVLEDDAFMIYCPFASTRAWEVRLAPAEPIARFASLSDDAIERLAHSLGRACRALHRRLGEHDFNLLVREPPTDVEDSSFTIDILPRTGGDAGFELLSGVPVCVIPPELAARELRAVLPSR